MKQIIWLILIGAAAGCGGASSIMLVNLKSGERVMCSSNAVYGGSPALAAIMRSRETEDCAKQYEAIGFTRASQLTPEQRANLSTKPTQIGVEIRQEQPKQ